jgi:N-acetylmuramic acid 6-phosphate (MurNAc-6-P) etherase
VNDAAEEMTYGVQTTLRLRVTVSEGADALWGGRLSTYESLAVKWVLNAITTGGHVLAGKVLQNRMIDLRVSNNKLYHRSVAIVAQLGKVSPPRAEHLLLRAIYDVDHEHLSEEITSAPVSAHLARAASQSSVVSCALLLALDHDRRYMNSVQRCKEALTRTPTIRKLLI